MRVLAVHAAEVEGRGLAVAVHPIGVGKSAAALNLTRLVAASRPDCVLLFGVAGAYPGGHGEGGGSLQVLEACVVEEEWFADEGVATPTGFLDVASLGFGRVGPFAADPGLSERAATVVGRRGVRGATVSTCSGTDELSRSYGARTQAAVETMEGASVAMVCAAFDVPWVEIRVVSNRTGDRNTGGWQLERALDRLREVVPRVVEVLAK